MRQLSSLDQLAPDQAWVRLMHWVRRGVGDVPDRLPYEFLDITAEGNPALGPAHVVEPTHLILATKAGHQTLRPFVRVSPRDLFLYWALVDALQPRLEEALGPATQVAGNRWTHIA